MPATDAQGALDTRGIWKWDPDGAGAVFTMNANIDPGSWAFPMYRFDTVRGLWSLPEMDETSEPAPEFIGELVYPAYARGKTVTCDGFTYGESEDEMREGNALMRAAFGPDLITGRRIHGRMVIEPHPTLGGSKHTFRAYCRLLDIESQRPPTPTHQPTAYFSHFIIDLRLSDPRIYEWDGAAQGDAKW